MTAPVGYDRFVWAEWPTTIRTAAKALPIHAAADSHIPKLSVAFRYAFARGRKTVTRGQKPNVDRIAKAVRAALEDVLPPMLLKVIVGGGQVGADGLKKLRATQMRTAKRAPGKIDFTFNAKSQAAIDWADKHAAELIDGITETTRERVNNAIAELLETGEWGSAYDEILDAVGSPERAELIARNETMTAASEGQRQSWDQAVEEGLLTGDEKRMWIAVGDGLMPPDEICNRLDGQVVGLHEPFSSEGEEYDGPPAHVNCRCTEGLI